MVTPTTNSIILNKNPVIKLDHNSRPQLFCADSSPIRGNPGYENVLPVPIPSLLDRYVGVPESLRVGEKNISRTTVSWIDGPTAPLYPSSGLNPFSSSICAGSQSDATYMAAMLRLLPTIFQFANLSASSSDSMSTFNNHKISSPNSVNTFSSMKHSSNYFSDAFSKAHTEINSPTITFHSFDNPEPNKSESRLDFFATATTVPSEDSDFCLYDILRLDKKSGTIGLQNIKTTDAPPAHVTSAQYSTTLKEAAARILDVRILTQVTLFQVKIYNC